MQLLNVDYRLSFVNIGPLDHEIPYFHQVLEFTLYVGQFLDNEVVEIFPAS